MHDDPDVLAGFAASEIQLITVAKIDAAVGDARQVLAQVLLWSHLARARVHLLAELRRAFHVWRLVELVVELELEIVELVSRGQCAAAAAVRYWRAREHAILDGPPALRR